MPQVSKRTFYALEAVLFIAYNAKDGAIASRDLAERQQLPARYLEPILQKLVRAGILKSVRGPAGGYALGRERNHITLKAICDVVGEDALPDSGLSLGSQVLRPALADAEAACNASLADIHMGALCERAEALHLPTVTPSPHDFII